MTSPPIFLLGLNTLSTLQLWIHLNKAMHYLLNSDSTSDKCTDQIWLLDVLQPRYKFPPAQAVSLMLLWCSPIPQGRHIPSAIQHLQWLQLPFQHQHTLIFPNDIQMPQHMLSTRSLCRFYVTCLDHILLSFLPIWDSSPTVLKLNQANATTANVPTLISSSPPSMLVTQWQEGVHMSDAVCHILQTGWLLLATAH